MLEISEKIINFASDLKRNAVLLYDSAKNYFINMMNITFPDGSVKQFEQGITPLQIAESISPRLAREVLAATLNGEEWDLSRPICNDCLLYTSPSPRDRG